ncbi:MAG: hypothetical protein IIT64_00830, partial [Bacteroidaceae bacterium]|nr:hypothetical protein [Bacteroidaceae bacterium]
QAVHCFLVSQQLLHREVHRIRLMQLDHAEIHALGKCRIHRDLCEQRDAELLVLDLIESGFYCKECKLGQNPQDVLPKVVHNTVASASQQLLTIHHVQRYPNQHFLVGCYRSDEHLAWIMGNNDKGTNLYNIRLKKRGTEERDGALSSADLAKMDVKFVILYKLGEEGKNEYKVFHVHHHATMDAERMQRAWYPNPRGNYFCYVFDEEVQLSTNIDVAKIIAHSQESGNHPEGMPIFLLGEELMKFKVVK